jgi:serine/threonine protein phosphatase PrpC
MAAPGLSIAMLSRQGARERNEDACGHWGNGSSGRDGPVCCVLADGAGGHGGGDIASRTAVAAVLDSVAAEPACGPRRVAELLELANRAVRARQSSSDSTRDMRSTLVVWIGDASSRTAAWGHVGDSRLYCFRDGRVLLRTRDHSLYQAMIDAGYAVPADPRSSPERNVLTASLGSAGALEAEVVAEHFRMAVGDAFLMCSDGLWGQVQESDMEAALQRAASPQAWIEELADRVQRQAGAEQDNYSALAIWFGSVDFSTRIGPGVAGIDNA